MICEETIGKSLEKRAFSSFNKKALIMGRWSCNYGELNEITDLYAMHMLMNFDIRKGDHIGIWSVNTPNWIFTYFALSKIGAIPVLFNTLVSYDEMVEAIKYSDIKTLFYGTGCKKGSYESKVCELRKRKDLPCKQYISIDRDMNNRWITRDRFKSVSSSEKALEALKKAKALVKADDIACMLFTSGTCSCAKGVLLKHHSILKNAYSMAKHMHWGEDDIMCLTVPLFHTFGVTAGILSSILCGASTVLIPYYRTFMVWDAIEKYRCSVLNGVPSMFLALVEKKGYENRDGSSIKSGIIAGSPVSRDEFMKICRRFSNMNLQPAYGMTEASPCVSIVDWDASDEDKAISCGKPLDGVKIRIRNLSNGELCPSCESGEIEVSGYNLMSGYYKLDDKNEESFTDDHWFRTGDVGFIDENGVLHISGRIKDIIIRSGENICPREIENVLRCDNQIKEAKVVGIPAPVVQEEIVALIVPKEGVEPNICRIKKCLSEKLADYKVPSHTIVLEEFPMTASGKVDIGKLRQIAIEQINNVKTN